MIQVSKICYNCRQIAYGPGPLHNFKRFKFLNARFQFDDIELVKYHSFISRGFCEGPVKYSEIGMYDQ